MRHLVIVSFILSIAVGLQSESAGVSTGYNVVDLDVLPRYDESYARDINDLGQVVGYCTQASGGSPIAYLWDTELGTQEIEPLPSISPSLALGINASGTVVGIASNPSGGGGFGFRWNQSEGITSIPNSGDIYAVNDDGLVAGESTLHHATIYADGMLYCYEENQGTVRLVKPGIDAVPTVSSFKAPKGSGDHWAHLAISGGTLYSRHGQALMVYDISNGRTGWINDATGKFPANSSPKVFFKKVGRDSFPGRHLHCRRMLVGPWCNQPDEYPGYNGFIGWPGAAHLRSGRWVAVFTSGYWHGSLPCTDKMLEDPYFRALFKHRRARFGGLPDIRAPRGGRAHIMYSDDQGQTWSKPQTLVDTEDDDRHPTILELDDGTLLCTFFTTRLRRSKSDRGNHKFDSMYIAYSTYILSNDGGKTWTEPKAVYDLDDAVQSSTSPPIQLSDGSVIWPITGRHDPANPDRIATGIYRSRDRGKTFELISFISTDHELWEPTIAELPDGRLVTIARRQGHISWSSDGGRTWTDPSSTGVTMFDPQMLILPNGVLACFHGSYRARGLRVILSPDGGLTWHGPAERVGYTVDPNAYGYSAPMLLPDGSVYIVYNHTGGHSAASARTAALWGLRLRVSNAANGITILPAPGSPAARGRSTTDLGYIDNCSKDP